MTVRDFTKTPAMRAAGSALAVAALLLVLSLVRALRPAPLPAAGKTILASIDGAKRAPARPLADIESAVENDLFSPDRTAPDAPYRMPGEASESKPRVEPMKPTVLGTAVASDGKNFATLQLGDASPKLVHVGDKIGEWVVRSIVRGKVVLETSEGARAELSVPKPGL